MKNIKYNLGRFLAFFLLFIFFIAFIWNIFMTYKSRQDILKLKNNEKIKEETVLQYDTFKVNEFNKNFIKDFFSLNKDYTLEKKTEKLRNYLGTKNLYSSSVSERINSLDWTDIEVVSSEVVGIKAFTDRLRINTKVIYNTYPRLNLEKKENTDFVDWNVDEPLQNEVINLTYTVKEENSNYKIIQLPYLTLENTDYTNLYDSELLKEYKTDIEIAQQEGNLYLDKGEFWESLRKFFINYFDIINNKNDLDIGYISDDKIKLNSKDYNIKVRNIGKVYVTEKGYRVIVLFDTYYKNSNISYFSNEFIFDIEKIDKNNYKIVKIYRD